MRVHGNVSVATRRFPFPIPSPFMRHSQFSERSHEGVGEKERWQSASRCASLAAPRNAKRTSPLTHVRTTGQYTKNKSPGNSKNGCRGVYLCVASDSGLLSYDMKPESTHLLGRARRYANIMKLYGRVRPNICVKELMRQQWLWTRPILTRKRDKGNLHWSGPTVIWRYIFIFHGMYTWPEDTKRKRNKGNGQVLTFHGNENIISSSFLSFFYLGRTVHKEQSDSGPVKEIERKVQEHYPGRH